MSAKLTAFAVSRPGAYYEDFLLDNDGSSSLSVSLLRSYIDDFLSDNYGSAVYSFLVGDRILVFILLAKRGDFGGKPFLGSVGN